MIIKKDLCGKWQRSSRTDKTQHNCAVPGSILHDLMQENAIEDPFWRTNEYATREMLDNDFLYKREFTVSSEDLQADRINLVCEGLDTIAEIFVNNILIEKANNMHRTYSIDVKKVLQAGNNTIEIWFLSSLQFIRNEDATNDIHYASTGCIHGNAALRKAHYMFGWDWGPQLPDSGIFRPIYLLFTHEAALQDVYIQQDHTQGVSVSATIEAWSSHNDSMDIELILTAPDGNITKKNAVWQGEKLVLNLPVENPQLWWPNGLGAQPLYRVTVRLCKQGVLHDIFEKKIGLRTITVSTEKDQWGNEFAFVVNGEKVFAMGANYIPQDNIIPRITKEKYRDIVAQSAAANMNMLRVWGGGYYPDDAFYDACDEFGIMIWQDMMFACNVYALTNSFEESIIQETYDNVRRLRHHASLALWCTNNEMEWGWGEGWQRILGHHPRYKADYLKIFEMILPRALKQCDTQTFFWPSSPSSGGAYDYPNDPNRGDQHYWEVWHSGKPFTEYRNHHFRFCSEYGFQSFPGKKTLNSFTLPQDRNIFSKVMESHQKNGLANTKILTYVADYFLYPKNMDSLAYVSQILQLKAIQYGVEHWRQNRGRCMGSLYWQLNDCWPVASWASIDYYGRWKALHYGAKRFYAPVCASAREKQELDSEISYYVHNETRETRNLQLTVRLFDTKLNTLFETKMDVNILPLCSQCITTIDFASMIQDEGMRQQVVAEYVLTNLQGVVISKGCTQFVKPKHFTYTPLSYHSTVEDCGDYYKINVTANGFSHYTELCFAQSEAIFSDNFFDITHKEGATVFVNKSTLSSLFTAQELKEQLQVRSVVNTYSFEEE